MLPLQPTFFISIVAALTSARKVRSAPQSCSEKDKVVGDVFEFIRSHGGIVNPKLAVQAEPGTHHFGVYATDGIREGEVISSTPWFLTLKPSDTEQVHETEDICRTVRAVIDEMRLGDESDFAPYVRYLKSLPDEPLPCLWSDAGQDLLAAVFGPDDLRLEAYLCPDERWVDDCDGSTKNPLHVKAALLTFTRETFDVMAPPFDLFNHHNGYKYNTRLDIYEGQKVEMKATRDIDKGEQVYESYNFCNGCTARDEGYGTPDILLEYGFVEDIPQRWTISDEIEFDLDYKHEGSDELQLSWVSATVPSKAEVSSLQHNVNRLENLQISSLASSAAKVPEHELRVIQKYHSALLVALKHAIKEAQGNEGTIVNV